MSTAEQSVDENAANCSLRTTGRSRICELQEPENQGERAENRAYIRKHEELSAFHMLGPLGHLLGHNPVSGERLHKDLYPKAWAILLG